MTKEMNENAEYLMKCIEIKMLIQLASETGIDISKECEPIKDYEGNNIFLLDLKREAKEAGFI